MTRPVTAGEHHTVTMSVTDAGGLSTTTTAQFDVVERTNQRAPVDFAVLDDPSAGTDGLRPLQNIVLFADAAFLPDSRLAWDLDGDGAYDDDHGFNTVVSYAAAGTYELGLRVDDPANGLVTVRRTLVVDAAGADGGGPPGPTADPSQATPVPAAPAAPQVSVSTPTTANVPAAIVAFGRRLLSVGPVVLTDGVRPGTRPAAGRDAPGLNLSRRTLVLGRLFATRPARARIRATARIARRTVTLGRLTVTLPANSSRLLRLKVPAAAIRLLRRVRQLPVTTQLAVTEPGSKTVSAQRLARIAVARR